jgi:hypothetical protein
MCDKALLCKLGLTTRDDVKKWVLNNHPDRGGKVDNGLFKEVKNCYSRKEFCDDPKLIKKAEKDKAEREAREAEEAEEEAEAAQRHAHKARWSREELIKRDHIYKCMRQTENWGKMMPKYKLDSSNFAPDQIEMNMAQASPKLAQLFRIIEQVDANDLATHGTYFKHFIFSDVKDGGYGAKILAGAFIAKGYKNLITAQKVPNQSALRLTLANTGADGKDKSFGLLSSTALFQTVFNQKFKKEVLTLYNKRPDNIHGANMRFIILDSGYKEGIDLFDVKYVHIFEPSMTIADLKQTVGRATRTCGQKGLNFEPNVGWPLYVYNYYIAIPPEIKDVYEASEPNLLRDPAKDKRVFDNKEKLKETTALYVGYDPTLLKLEEHLYKLAPVFSTDFPLTEQIHRVHDITYLYDMPEEAQMGGAGPDPIKCAGKCGKRSTNDIPATVDFLAQVYNKYKHNRAAIPAKNSREYFCTYMKTHPEYCEQINTEWAHRASLVPTMVFKKTAKAKNTTAKAKKSASLSPSPRLSPASASLSPASPRLSPASLSPAKSPSLSPASASLSPGMSPNEWVKQISDEELRKHLRFLGLPTKDQPKTRKGKEQKYLEMLEQYEINESPKYLEIGPKSPEYFDIMSSPTPYKNESPEYLEILSSPTPLGTGSRSRSRSTRTRSRSTGTRSRSTGSRSSTGTRKNKSASPLQDVLKQLDLVPYVAPIDEHEYAIEAYTGNVDPKLKQTKVGPPAKKLNFTQMRDFIKTNYAKDFTWEEIVIENRCVDPQAPAAPQAQAAQQGGASRIMKLNPTQKFVSTFFTPPSPYKGLLLWHSVGTGKCHAKDTEILMYDGTIKLVQDVLVGDRLMGDDSKPRTVLSLARGQDTLYDIIPVKGDKYTVNSEHILCLKYSSQGSITYLGERQKNLPYKATHIDKNTVTVKSKSFSTRTEAETYLGTFNDEDRTIEIEVKDYLKLSPSLKREFKGYRTGVEFTHKPVDFDPYIVGLWLGDGSKRDPVITSQDSKILKYLMNKVPQYGLKLVYQSKYDYRITSDGSKSSNAFLNTLRKYNILNNKHIPYDYKCNDHTGRLQLLAGLIDSDGSYSNKDKCYEITQKSDVLANDILFLARSLGFAAYKKSSHKSWTYKDVKKTNVYNRIHISGEGLEEIPVKLTRKQMVEVRLQKKNALLTGITVEKSCELGDYYGFTLDGNCRYLLGDFTVTHNTCTAIATATSSFERAGYTILWVTRNTLKSDVYKNMFDDVCHAGLAEKMTTKGLKIPDDPSLRRRLLSKNLIEPISYRTFSNLLTPGEHNVYMDMLKERNGPADILRKTLIVIDEAHKLYGGDLKASERPNMKILEKLLQKSYDTSGKDSARLLLMTATPFTNSPMELFKLVNLCKEDKAEYVTTQSTAFKAEYMDADNALTESGVKKLADKLSGYISYLNREQDPTQFAQPIMIEVPALMSHIVDPALRAELFKTSESKASKAETAKDKKTKEAKIKELTLELKKVKQTLKQTFEKKKTQCKTLKTKVDRDRCISVAKEEMSEELKIETARIKEEIAQIKAGIVRPDRAGLKALKERVETLKNSLNQEAMLVEKCKSIKLV